MDITLTQVLSFIVPGISFGKSWVYGNKWKWAPAYGMMVQCGWVFYTYRLGSDAVGMFILAVALFFMESRNLYKWLKED